jgi:DNA mismatch endonuclease (patch repair protein)
MEESWASSPAIRASMQHNKSRDTGPELALRRLLFARGLRYRVSYRPVAGQRITVDIAFPRARTVVLVDGCFWHGCPDHHRAPKTNVDYWTAKLARNRARDRHVSEALTAAGWTVLRFWEHQDPVEVADAVEQAIRSSRPPG